MNPPRLECRDVGLQVPASGRAGCPPRRKSAFPYCKQGVVLLTLSSGGAGGLAQYRVHLHRENPDGSKEEGREEVRQEVGEEAREEARGKEVGPQGDQAEAQCGV